MWAEVEALAARQHGVVTTAQLASAGLTPDAIAHCVKRGRLTRLHRGVHRVGPLTDTLTSPMAAVLACGLTAALSHQSAATHHGARAALPGPIDVTAEGKPRNREGIRAHRTVLAPDERTTRRGIPVTTPARTILDLAGVLALDDLERTVSELVAQRLVAAKDVVEQMARHPRRRGVAALRALLAEPLMTRSEAEREFRALIEQAGLPRPRVNAKIGSYEVDFFWREAQLVVEVDGFAFHGSRTAFERDRRKQAELVARGLRVSRVTWRQLADEPLAVVARVAAAL